MKSSNYKRYACVGVGGFSCSCCAPQSGNKYAARARTILKRQAKRRFDRQVTKLTSSEVIR